MLWNYGGIIDSSLQWQPQPSRCPGMYVAWYVWYTGSIQIAVNLWHNICTHKTVHSSLVLWIGWIKSILMTFINSWKSKIIHIHFKSILCFFWWLCSSFVFLPLLFVDLFFLQYSLVVDTDHICEMILKHWPNCHIWYFKKYIFKIIKPL